MVGTVDGRTQVLLVGTTEWVGALGEALADRPGTTLLTATTVEEARSAFDTEQVDGIVTEYAFADGTGLDLVRAVRAESDTLPVIVCTAAGDEEVASEAIAAGVTDYVPAGETTADTVATLTDRIDVALRAAQRTHAHRDRARQFDAIFEDHRTATWVLDADGTVTRVNGAAGEMADADVQAGEPFWTVPWWTETPGLQADVRRLVETALAGSFGNAVVMRDEAADGPKVVELSARPVSGDHEDVVSVVVEGVDVTDRVDLERDLRQSEQLHRVTLKNMTDTVLITDEDGEYTYVCPNAHFIFGYTAEEIRELGTIQDLLGEDLFDREELAEQGVLKNIETTATDKAGNEHTLLINVREVSIQDGTLLYSCRDITKRKQREQALTTLQGRTRKFLYAETHHEIAQGVVDDAADVLNLDASAVYLFDADGTELRPVAASPAMEHLHGPLRGVRADGEDLTSHSFVEDESAFFDDVHDAERLQNRATELRSAAYVPLGDHGVFIAGSSDVGAFDEVRQELTDLLAATAEAALDRVSREERLREQDRALQRQNDQLSSLNRTNETIREIDKALVRAETRQEIDHAVCDLLTEDDRLQFAWIGEADPADERVEPRAWGGNDRGYLDAVSVNVDAEGAEPAGRTAATCDVSTVPNVADRLHDEEWRKTALARDFLSVLAIPLVYNDLSYGVLTVYADTQNAFDDRLRAVLAELGETIASAISAIERKNALLTTSITRITFDVDDPTFVLSRLARTTGGTLSYRGGVQQAAGRTDVFVTVEDVPVSAVEDVARDLVAVEDVQRISTDDAGGIVRLRLSQPFLAPELADHGAVLRSASVDPTGTTLVVDVPESVDGRHITQLVRETFSNIDLRSKQTLDQSTDYRPPSRFLDQVTDRQFDVLQTAYYSGFFESPRENTGEEIAETLDISSAAFYQHIRTVERKLFSSLFDEFGVSPSSTTSEVE